MKSIINVLVTAAFIAAPAFANEPTAPAATDTHPAATAEKAPAKTAKKAKAKKGAKHEDHKTEAAPAPTEEHPAGN